MADLPEIVRLLLALAIVIALMGGLALILKKIGLADTLQKTKGGKRLKLIESLPLDARRRLVIVGCDDAQHLVILGADNAVVVQNNIGGKHEV